MAKVLTIAGMVVGGLFAVGFGLDLAMGILGGANSTMAIGFLVCGLLLGYMSWNAFRDIR